MRGAFPEHCDGCLRDCSALGLFVSKGLLCSIEGRHEHVSPKPETLNPKP